MNCEEKAEELARLICNKPPQITASECFSSRTGKNPLCSEQGRCRIDEKSDEQLNYVFSSITENIFLRACPGSGKTEVIGLKTAYEITKWDKTPGGIAVLTFTNNAAEVIEKRARQFASMNRVGYPHYIGTFDSWLHGYLAHPFGHKITGYEGKEGDKSIRLIECSSTGDFLYGYRANAKFKTFDPNPRANQYYYDEDDECFFDSNDYKVDLYRNSLNLELRQKIELEETKKKFEKAGFATYQDIEKICHELLLLNSLELGKHLSQRFPFIIVDECQDLSSRQIEILEILRFNGTILHFVGDLHQSIYTFRKVYPEHIENHVREKDFDELGLLNNYRNCKPIADVCSALVGSEERIKSIPQSTLKDSCVCVIFQKEKMRQLPVWFSHYLENLKIDKQHTAIVARGKEGIYRMRKEGNSDVRNEKRELVMAIYLWVTASRHNFKEALDLFGKYISSKFFKKYSRNAQKYYQPEPVNSALEWRLFLADVLSKCCQDKKIGNLELTWTQWCKALNRNLYEYVCSSKDILGIKFSNHVFDSFRTKAPNGKANEYVSNNLCLSEREDTFLRITTIHKIKGETLEALMLVSNLKRTRTNDGDGFWKMWFESSSPESARFAYVASSRPSQLLVWAIPYSSNLEKEKIERIGFKILDVPELMND